MRAAPKVHVRPLRADQKSIRAAAETVSLAFGHDPLIRWISRDPSAPGWEALYPAVQRWQEARLREYVCRGIAAEAVTEDESTPRQVGVCFMFPPRPLRRWRLPTWWPTYLRVLWEQYWLKPKEPVADQEKVERMLEHHFASAESFYKRFPPRTLYYVEIVAVDPSSQGLGVGKKLMSWVLEQVGDSPCYLECTNATNVPFYEKYGFHTVEEHVLRHPKGTDSRSSNGSKTEEDGADAGLSTTVYYMVRDVARKHPSVTDSQQSQEESA